MTHKIFWITLLSLLSVTLCRQEDCEVPPKVDHSTVRIEEEDDYVRAIYTCDEGYQLKGESSIACNLDTDEWLNDAPTCFKSQEETTTRSRKKAEIAEDTRISNDFAEQLDMSCVSARVTAPDIAHGQVLKYDRRKKNGHVFLVAIYTCNDNYELENTALNVVYCSRKSWIGEQPTCVSLGEYEEEYGEEGEEDDEEAENEIKPAAKPEKEEEETEAEEEENHVDILDNEIETHAKPKEQVPAQVPEEEKEEEEEEVTEANRVIPPTADPYTPRVLNESCGPERGGCDHECSMVLYPGENTPRIACSCYSGFTLDPYDFRRCHDIDECQGNNGGCEQICTNVPGSFECSCGEGLQINSVTGNTCEDVNECLLRNGHGPCQDTCRNVWGGYVCSCEGIPGTQLSADSRTCRDAGECAHSNGGCSHTCLATLGRVFCICPNGLYLSDDWKTCKDINECELPEIQAVCKNGCNNTFGSYVCFAEETVETTTPTPTELPPCEPGFSRHPDDLCHDIDECADGSSGCEYCENTSGGFECTCPAGYELGPDEKKCVDINECEAYEGVEDENGETYRLCSQGCRNLDGSYECTCQENFHLLSDNRNCARDLCEDLRNKTSCSHECVDEHEGFACKCPSGYVLGSDFKTCELIPDACLIQDGNNRCLPGRCVSQGADSYTCDCPAGFRHLNDGCSDIDECESVEHGCSHYCANTEGSFQCLCPDGFRLADDQRTCTDIDECGENENLCDHGGKLCENTPGSFRCFCPEGSEAQDDGLCVLKTNGCSKDNGGCSHECLVNGDTHECRCPVGMELEQDRRTCAYENVCLNNNGGCAQICRHGECSCESGFVLSSDGKSCEDMDECTEQNAGCDQICVNHPGGYSCLCENGFQMLNGSCADIDECERRDACRPGLVCANSKGAFECVCPAGYGMSANGLQECFDVDECASRNGNCSHYCINLPGGYQCSCPPGQMLIDDERTCDYVDECELNNGGCSHDCTYEMGKVSCSCPKGYKLDSDGRTCRDVDECASQNGKCSHSCLNSEGSFACDCPAGYYLGKDGLECFDVDECVENNGNCSNMCINLLGSFTCTCESGYELREDKRTCSDVDECAQGLHDCSHTCINVLGGYECSCPEGYILGSNRLTCTDVDECAEDTRGGCSHTCVNSIGSFHCECPEGYTIGSDNKTCAEIDYCQDSKCSHQCVNIPGGFECACPIGLSLSEDGFDCLDVNECDVGNGGCSHICENVDGSYTCSCPTGWSLESDGRSCLLTDFCSMNNGGCEQLCANGPDGSVCTCREGFSIDPSKPFACQDVDECASQHTCEQVCRNTIGSFECDCHPGYAKNALGQCEDINECQNLNGGCSADCINTEGSYRCACPPGLKLSADKHTCREIRDSCQPLAAPKYGEVHCTRSRQKAQLFYRSKCSVWCQKGYRLVGPPVRHCNGTGQWDSFENQCVPLTCPRLPRPEYGTILPSSCLLGQVYMGEKCILHCAQGFVPVGKRVAICNVDQQWSTNSSLECVPVPKNRVAPVFIKCPQNTTLLLPTGQNSAYIRLEKPVTNVDDRYVEAYPTWAKNLEAHLGAGVHVITFRAHQAELHKYATCRTVITVRMAEPPKVLYCPPSYKVTMRPNVMLQPIFWKEPEFEGHGQLKKIFKSKAPGEFFGPGVHTIYYEATSQDDLISRCEFKIVVRAPHMQVQMAQYNAESSSSGASSVTSESSASSSSMNFNAGMLANHESYVICQNKPPVKITSQYSIHVPAGCYLKHIRINPIRQYMNRRLMNGGWRHFRNFL